MKNFDKDFSFKTFRTYSASSLFEKILPDARNETDPVVKKSLFDLANVEVAKLCNHQKVAGASNPADKVSSKQLAYEKHLKKLKELKKEVKDQRLVVQQAPAAKAKAENKKLKTLKEKLEKAETKATQLEKNLEVVVS